MGDILISHYMPPNHQQSSVLDWIPQLCVCMRMHVSCVCVMCPFVACTWVCVWCFCVWEHVSVCVYMCMQAGVCYVQRGKCTVMLNFLLPTAWTN